MGCSRETFYRYKNAVDEGGIHALLEKSRKKPNFKNRVDEDTEEAVKEFAVEFPAYGQLRASNELRKREIFVSPSGVRSIWLRHNLASKKKRLLALEAKSAKEGFVLTEAQVEALEKKKDDDYRNAPSWLSWLSGHILCWYIKRSWQDLSTNLC